MVYRYSPMTIRDLLQKLIRWFLNKSPSKLETFAEEIVRGDGVELVRYNRKQIRAYRTWRAVYKSLEYDLVFGWDTLEVIAGVPSIRKQNRLSTHVLNIYKHGLHARYNPMRRCHEPDILVILKDQEVCLETLYMPRVVQQWRAKTRDRPEEQRIRTRDEVFDLIIDQVAKYAIRHPPAEIDPLKIQWLEVVEQTTRLILGSPSHQVFPEVSTDAETDWWTG